ncbi:hypothetical protein HID58_091826 [Brassica napus]|uniref:Uncharacterized protein n=1 Tax=Brassica napus TaxID=3708 RepID=A0ABQ7WYG6_BRANA|nr:hypothetical protein HID58_091826 [Brassica napus]
MIFVGVESEITNENLFEFFLVVDIILYDHLDHCISKIFLRSARPFGYCKDFRSPPSAASSKVRALSLAFLKSSIALNFAFLDALC